VTAVETTADAPAHDAGQPSAPAVPVAPVGAITVRPVRASRAAPSPPAASPTPRRPRHHLVLVALALVAVLANLVMVLDAERTDREAAADLVAADRAGTETVRARETSTALDPDRDRLAAQLDATAGLVALARADLGTEVAGRDGRAAVLVGAEQQLSSLRLALDAANGRILEQTGAVEHLRTCFRGITRALNLAGLDLVDGAAAELFAVAESCGRAEQVLGATP